jgi:hypothetical protein
MTPSSHLLLLLCLASSLLLCYCKLASSMMMLPSTSSTSARSRLVYGSDDALFGSIEKEQGNAPFGNFLDAGTGMHSLRWIATLGEERGMTKFTAITADKVMRTNVQNEATALGVSHLGDIVIGNWFGEGPERLELNEKYDTILADYLIGAMDGFSPYKQDQMIGKLVSLLKPGGRLYIVGLQPIPDSAPGEANIICKVRQVRDACILLAGHRCYREYPLDWIQRQVQGHPQLELIRSSTFPILYRHRTIVKQIQVARSKLPYFPSPELAEEMGKTLDDLEAKSKEATDKAGGKIRLGFDYIVTARKTGNDDVVDE